MDRLLRFFIERHLLVNVIVVAIIVAGVVTATRSNREGFPNVSIPRLLVRAQLPGASARDVETKVTIPLEEAIEEVDNVDTYSTVVNDNQSITTVELYDELDEEDIRETEQELRDAIDAITDFPEEMDDEPSISRLNPGKFPIIEIALAGPFEALPAAAHLLERRLRRIDDVGEITLVGLRDPEVRILVDPSLAREHGFTLLDVVNAIERRNVSSTGGVLETERRRRQVVLWSRFDDPIEVRDTVLRFDSDGGRLVLSDIARIEVGREDTGLVAHTNGQSGVSIVVSKRVQADILRATDRVVEVVRQTPLPAGVEAVLVNDESFLTRNRLELIANNGMIGGILVAAIVLAFLTPGAAFWVLLGVPVVILGTIALLPHVGMTINLLSTGGFVVVLGMLVDDAVVVAERILARRQQGLDANAAALEGASAVSRPVIASAITTVLAFLPMFAIGGLPGKIAWNIPAVVVLALMVSLLESFLILPSHMTRVGRGAGPSPKRAFVLRLEARYESLLRILLPRRMWVVGAFSAIFIVTIGGILPQLGFNLFPQDDSDALYIRVSTELGTPLEQTEGVVAALEDQLPDLVGSDLLAVTARIGHQEAREVEREHGSAENEAVISVLLHPKSRRLTAAEWAAELKRTLRVPPNVTLVYEPEVLGPPIGRPVEIHVSGNDNERRRAAAAAVSRYVEEQPDLVDVDVDERPGIRQIDLNLDYSKLALRGLDADDVGIALKAAFFGLEASEHRDLDDTTTYRVMLEPSARRSLDSLLEVPVRNRRNELVRLRDVVQPIEVPAVSRIYHRDGVRCSTVTASFDAGSEWTSTSFAAHVEKDLFPRFSEDTMVVVELGGEAVETRKTTRDLRLVALLSLVGIWVVIALMLGSFLEAIFVVSVVPFALVGVVITFFLHGQDLSMFAILGAIGLAGVVVNASIVMVDSIHRRVQDLPPDDREGRNEAMISALVARLRPILVTSLSTLVGVLPTAYGIGGHDAVLSPMSLALGWGLAFSTLITLFLVPSLYSIATDLRERGRRFRRGAAAAVVIAAALSLGCDAMPAVQNGGPVAGWPTYGNDPGGSRYSPLQQIDRGNVRFLETAWIFRTGDDGSDVPRPPRGGRAPKAAFQATPILDEGVLYFCTPRSRVFAIDAARGTLRWGHDPEPDLTGAWSATCRGVALWNGGEPAASCSRRIFAGTMDARLLALDAETGRLCLDFGDGGAVDLRKGIGDIRPGEYYITSPPTVVGDIVSVGALVGDNRRVDAPGGVVRGYDVRSGQLRWAFDPVPPGTGALPPAPDGSPRFHRGTPNAWSIFSADPERELLFVPTGNPSPDFYGGERAGKAYYGSSVVAIDARSGEARWHFQTVHNDLWDYDVGSQPTLLDLEVDGELRAALLQPTKMGHLFLLDRETGVPLYPVEERAAPTTDVAGERSAATQPIPTHPKPLQPHRLAAEDAFGFTPWDRGACREQIEELRNDGIFTPPSLRGSVLYPGTGGGANWGSAALDPARRWAVLNLNHMAQSATLVPQGEPLDRKPPTRGMGLGAQEGTPYSVRLDVLLSPFGVPCTPPPWGTLVAVDLVSGEKVWEVPFGTTRDMTPFPIGLPFGMPSMGGPIVTAGGLVFIGASMDDYLRAYDIETGEELWKERLPAGGQATPMTYRLSEEGRQFVVIAAGGHGTLGTTPGDALLAFALPRE